MDTGLKSLKEKLPNIALVILIIYTLTLAVATANG